MIPDTSHNRVSLRNINNWNYEKEGDAQSQSIPDNDAAIQTKTLKTPEFSLSA